MRNDCIERISEEQSVEKVYDNEREIQEDSEKDKYDTNCSCIFSVTIGFITGIGSQVVEKIENKNGYFLKINVLQEM